MNKCKYIYTRQEVYRTDLGIVYDPELSSSLIDVEGEVTARINFYWRRGVGTVVGETIEYKKKVPWWKPHVIQVREVRFMPLWITL